MGTSDIIKRGPNWTYSSGPTHQLGTWVPYLDRLNAAGLLTGRYAFVHCTNQYPINHIYDGFPWDLWEQTVLDNPSKQLMVVLDSHTEGPSWRHVASTVRRMMDRDSVDPRCIIQWTGGIHESQSPIQTVTVMDAFCIISWPEHCFPVRSPVHHFVHLARIPKLHRVLAAVEILRRGLNSYGHVSCGVGDHGWLNRDVYDKWVPSDLQHHFPMMLPGDTFNAIQTPEFTVESTTRPEIVGAFCSVIAETSHDLMSPNVCTAFMTEKTEKCFLLEQVPIWIAAPAQIALAREWGFDVFDDIIDHAYDQEPDPHKRIVLAIDQLSRICAKPIEFWQRYKADNQERFTRNRQLCMQLRDTHPELQYHKLVDCIARMPTAG